ncbi:hypothetical protein CBR_g38815 [Chara braunii]|uniref:Polyphenol oxidase C-terminal domain-containing protein n=1 Tax=Chara braunii TaxID=69332 RepID=A0A388LQN6_CHABU|nr:hypothetical protein CBR_g38815 [Chara braunii]|eukprot:GBG84533.1 hypothetical protein CBR_g38815 [Chara braunii]
MSLPRNGRRDNVPRGAAGRSFAGPGTRVITSSSSSRRLTSPGAAAGLPQGRRLRGGGGGGVADRSHGGSRRTLASCHVMQLPSMTPIAGTSAPPPAAAVVAGPITSSGDTVSVILLPPVLPAEARVSDLMEVVSFRNFSYNPKSRFSFHVFLNYPSASLSSPRSGNPHYVTSYFSMMGSSTVVTMNTQVSLRGTLRALGLSGRDSMSIQVVPEFGKAGYSVTFNEIGLEYLTGP